MNKEHEISNMKVITLQHTAFPVQYSITITLFHSGILLFE